MIRDFIEYIKSICELNPSKRNYRKLIKALSEE